MVAREIEDLQALITQAGGKAYVYAISSGAALALATAATAPGITKLALYEPPFMAEVGDVARIKRTPNGSMSCSTPGTGATP